MNKADRVFNMLDNMPRINISNVEHQDTEFPPLSSSSRKPRARAPFAITENFLDDLKNKSEDEFYIEPASNNYESSEAIKVKFFKTKACNNLSCKNPECTYAHTLSELKIPCCKFGMKCFGRTDKCGFIHPNESPEQYWGRADKHGRPKPNLPM